MIGGVFVRGDLAEGEGNPRGFQRLRAQHRDFLQDEADVRIGREQRIHVLHRLFAVAAIVVEELHHGHVAIGIAEHSALGRLEQRRSDFGDRRLLGRRLVGRPLGLQRVERFQQHFGMLDQIGAHDRLDRVGLLRVERRLRRRGRAVLRVGGAGCDQRKRAGEGRGGGQASDGKHGCGVLLFGSVRIAGQRISVWMMSCAARQGGVPGCSFCWARMAKIFAWRKAPPCQ